MSYETSSAKTVEPRAVRTGLDCSCAPDPDDRREWIVE
jgi:hypothetical protein